MSIAPISPSTTGRTPRRSWPRRAIAGLGIAVIGLLVFIAALFLYREEQIGSICVDDWVSSSTNPGRCSGHGGVDEDIYVDTLLGLTPDDTLHVRPVALGFGGLGLFAAGVALAATGRRGRDVDVGAPTLGTASALAALDPGVIELRVTVRKRSSGRTATVGLAGDRPTVVPFLLRVSENRGAAQLSGLLAGSRRRFGRKGRHAIEVYGAELFDALLPDPAGSRYREALAVAHRTGGRLRVVLDLDEETSDQPWEYLYDKQRGAFLAMSEQTSVVRLVDDGNTTNEIPPVDRLRVLIMGASPRGLPPLDIDQACTDIEKRLAEWSSIVQVRRVDGQTPEALQDALSDVDPHVFHFVGHGKWDRELEDGAVVFGDDHDGPDAMSGRDLGVLLARRNLRLAMFSSCDAARTSASDRFAGVAGSLVAQGVPATIGMQYPVGDTSASTFAAHFLEMLVESKSIDEALAEARTAVYTRRSGIEWGTAVFTSRVPVDEIIPWAPE